jgi:tRNA threonylcarbamoyladenosine biosynthesis protein TsaB
LKVLAVDTSSSVAAVAVIDDTKLLGEYILNHKKTHSQKLMLSSGTS